MRHPEQAGNAPEVVVQAGILDRDPPRAARAKRVHDEHDRLGEPAADDNPLGIGARATHAVEVVGERLTELGGAARVEIDEPLARCLGQDPAHRPQPGGSRELRNVGAAVAEVEADLRGGRTR